MLTPEHAKHINALHQRVIECDISANLMRIQYQGDLESAYQIWQDTKKHNQAFMDHPTHQLPVKLINSKMQESALFLLFHHRNYLQVPFQLVRQSEFKGVGLILTKSSYDERLLERASITLDIPVTVVLMDDKGLFLRHVKRLIDKRYAVFIMPDLPFGFSTLSNAFFDAEFGTLTYKTGYLRLAQLLKVKACLLIERDNCIEARRVTTYDEVNQAWCTLLSAEPVYFDRLHELHKMCEFKDKRMLGNKTFQLPHNENQYCYDCDTRKLFSSNEDRILSALAK